MANMERQKDQEMAQRLKAEGRARTTSRCCICGNIISTGARRSNGVEMLPDTSNHVTLHCKGPTKRGGSAGHSTFSISGYKKAA